MHIKCSTDGMSRRAMFVAANISKAYGPTRALDDVTIRVAPGSIHALLGENGAGKSTLVKVIGGVVRPDSGKLLMDNEEVSIRGPIDAFSLGIAVVHQELALLPNLSVAKNLAAGSERGFRVVRARKLAADAARTLERLEVPVDPEALVANLSPAIRQEVEIARALARGSRLLILDEPTSSLPASDRARLMGVLDRARKTGLGIVFITHNLREAIDVADSITILRNGQVVDTVDASLVSVNELIRMMTGMDSAGGLGESAHVPRRHDGETPRLTIEHLRAGPEVQDVSFTAYPGEIVGIAGLLGAGQSEVLRAVFGQKRHSADAIILDGRKVNIGSPKTAVGLGIGLVSGDRQRDGLFAKQSIAHNLCAVLVNSKSSKSPGVTRHHWTRKDLHSVAAKMVADIGVSGVGSLSDAVTTLSGGNQQKLLIARWLAVDPSLLLADDPTRGVSVGSKLEVYRLLREAAAKGTTIVIVSSELDELTDLCDRVVIMHHGHSVETVQRGLSSDELLMHILASRDMSPGSSIESS